MPLSTREKEGLVSQFATITQQSERTAQKYLREARYNINTALDAWEKNSGSGSANANREAALKKQFDSLRTSSEDTADTIGAESAMEYLQNIGISLDNASLFTALEFLKAETVGEIKKEGFVKAWKEAEVDGTIAAQKAYMKNLIFSMSVKPDVFKNAYRYTFVVGKEGDQRALSLENSLVYWDMLFKAPGRPWIGKQTGIDWLALWKTFLQEKWTRSVNRDMWNQTLEFAVKSIDDETLSFWSEDGAWPGVIDEFVAWYRAKASSGAMDLDA